MIDRIQNYEGGDYAGQVDQIKEQALTMLATAREQFAVGSDSVKNYVVEKPARALGIALGVGVVLGWLIKRR
jgi:ElaB/YqjD/DUF883 family membrane-anchored ribosome-binding protein